MYIVRAFEEYLEKLNLKAAIKKVFTALTNHLIDIGGSKLFLDTTNLMAYLLVFFYGDELLMFLYIEALIELFGPHVPST
jgi:hypothetical protein